MQKTLEAIISENQSAAITEKNYITHTFIICECIDLNKHLAFILLDFLIHMIQVAYIISNLKIK